MSDATNHRILLDLERNDRERLRVSIAEFKSKTYVHVRAWYQPAGGGDLQPGKGISVKPEHLQQVIEALQRAASEVPK